MRCHIEHVMEGMWPRTEAGCDAWVAMTRTHRGTGSKPVCLGISKAAGEQAIFKLAVLLHRAVLRCSATMTEIGASSTRLHACGPMGADSLTIERFVVLGEGRIRHPDVQP